MLGKVSKLRFGLSLLGSREPEFFGAPALRFWIDVRGGDKGALSPDRPVAYLLGNNLAGFGRTGTNLLKLGALLIILPLLNPLAHRVDCKNERSRTKDKGYSTT